MKGTEKIIAHIRADAETQSAEILARAEEQCAAIRADFEEKARERYNERLLAGEKACEDRVDSMDRIARMEAKKGLLALKQEMVSKSFELACEKLVNLPEADYVELLARLAAAGRPAKLRLSPAEGAFAGGLLLRRGSIETNCSAELLVELRRGEMSSELAGVLFD